MAISILLSWLLSVPLFGLRITPLFVAGLAMVVASVVLFSAAAEKPHGAHGGAHGAPGAPPKRRLSGTEREESGCARPWACSNPALRTHAHRRAPAPQLGGAPGGRPRRVGGAAHRRGRRLLRWAAVAQRTRGRAHRLEPPPKGGGRGGHRATDSVMLQRTLAL